MNTWSSCTYFCFSVQSSPQIDLFVSIKKKTFLKDSSQFSLQLREKTRVFLSGYHLLDIFSSFSPPFYSLAIFREKRKESNCSTPWISPQSGTA